MRTKKRVLLAGSCGRLPGDAAAWPPSVEVRRAETAALALASHATEPADVIAVDLDLPDGPAEPFCERVRALKTQRRVSVVVVCGPQEADRRRAAECRANAQLVRPAEARVLAAEIQRQLSVAQRASYRVLARVTVGEGGAAHSFFCTSRNVSASGILLETDEELRVGQALDCSFFLPGRLELRAQGKVVREASAPGGRQLGVRFVDLSDRDLEALGQFVRTWGVPH